MLQLPENPADFSPWHYKPWWCQPWSILLTGALGMIGSWLLFHRLWLTLPFTLLIGVWWLYFLILWPRVLKPASVGLPKREDSIFELSYPERVESQADET